MNESHSGCDRREFIRTGMVAGTGMLSTAMFPHVLGARQRDDTLRIGFVGLGGRGRVLLTGFAERNDCSVRSLCDVHEHRLAAGAELAEAHSPEAPLLFRDIRDMLRDDQLDAVVIATPDHWHCLGAAWACRAGKHVYVEKPLSHSVWEGRRLVELARQHDRVVQVGTQNRSAPFAIAARQYIESGKLGRILSCRIYNQKDYATYALKEDGKPPGYLNWQIWNGPCKDSQFNATRYQHWHDFWRYSGGDICNDGVHQMDLACMVLGIETLPKLVTSSGYLGEETAAEIPCAMTTIFQFDHFPLTFHLTLGTPYMLKTDPETRNSDWFPYWQQNATRIEIFGTEGVMFLGRHGGGWQVFDRPIGRQPVVKAQMFGRFPDPEHKQDFVRAIREARRPNADVQHGHHSATLCHLANISFRLGNQQLTIDRETEQITGNDAANKLLRREYREEFALDADVRIT